MVTNRAALVGMAPQGRAGRLPELGRHTHPVSLAGGDSGVNLGKKASSLQAGCLRYETARMAVLHNPFAQIGVFPGEQFLRELVAGAIGVVRGTGKMVVDPHPG